MLPAPEILEVAKEAGIDGIVLTNHYQKGYISNGDVNELVEKYIEEYLYTKKCGEKSGIKVFFGIEVTMEKYPNVHMLIYGIAVDFLRKYPYLFDYTQEELYETVKNEGGILVQAHPFRNGTTVLDTDYMDGVEINCHPLYKKSYCQELIKIAEDNDLLLTCGGDFHADTYRPKCGVYLPDDIADENMMVEYIKNSEEYSLRMQEPNEEESIIISV